MSNYLKESFKEMLHNEQRADNTIRTYTTAVNSFIDYFGLEQKKDIQNIEKKNVVDYINYLKEKFYKKDKYYKTTTINNRIIGINRFLNYNGKTMCKAKILYLRKTYFLDESELLLLNEIVEMLQYAKKHNMTRVYHTLRILIQTGIRVSEIRFITYESILEGKAIIKNKGTEREIPIPDDLRNLLMKYCENKKITSGTIIKTKNNKPVHRSYISREILRIANKLKIENKKAHPHNFRHFFALQFIRENGKDSIGKLADILGHRSLDTTRIYTRDTLSNIRNLMTLENLGIKIAP